MKDQSLTFKRGHWTNQKLDSGDGTSVTGQPSAVRRAGGAGPLSAPCASGGPHRRRTILPASPSGFSFPHPLWADVYRNHITWFPPASFFLPLLFLSKCHHHSASKSWENREPCWVPSLSSPSCPTTQFLVSLLPHGSCVYSHSAPDSLRSSQTYLLKCESNKCQCLGQNSPMTYDSYNAIQSYCHGLCPGHRPCPGRGCSLN